MRLEQLTFIRFIAAIAVVIHHFGLKVFPFSTPILHELFKQGDLGVSFFFFLSGFVMIIAYQNKKKINALNYLKNRFARIYPVFFLAAILLFVNKILSADGYMNFKGFLLHLSMLHAWIPGYQLSYNIASWTLSVELFFYIIFPILFNAFYSKKHLDLKKTLTIIFGTWLVTQIILVVLKPNFLFDFQGSSFLYNEVLRLFPLMHLNQFLVGNIFGLLFLKYGVNAVKNYDFQIIALTVLLLIILLFNPGFNLFGGLILIVFAPLVYLMACNNGMLTKMGNYKALVFLGEISYGIYILQYPVHYLCNYFFTKLGLDAINEGFKFTVMLVVLILFSAFSYLYIEKPMRDKIKNTRILTVLKKVRVKLNPSV